MRHRFVVFLALGALAGCSDEAGGRIEVFPGPVMYVEEGETVLHELRFDGERGGTFALVPGASTENRLVSDLVTLDGATFLRVTPLCSAIDAGSTDTVLETIEVSRPGTSASAMVSVLIESNERDDCAVQVVGWAGPCATKPMVIEPEIRLDPSTDAAQTICVEATVPDSFASVDVKFPVWDTLLPLSIAGADLLGLGPSSETRRELVVDGVLERFRGRREIEVTWTSGGSTRLVVTAGDPGDGVLRARSNPIIVPEYGASIVRFSSSYYEQDGTIPCVRATPRAPTTTTLVVRSDLDEIIAQGELACGEIINAVELITAIDSAPVGWIDVTLERCTRPTGCGLSDSACCALAGADVEVLDAGMFEIVSQSVAEDVASAPDTDSACLDLDGDDVPELAVVEAAGLHMYAGSGTPTDVRFVDGPALLAMPDSILALDWFDGGQATPILVGEFTSSPRLRRAKTDAWEPSAWASRPVTNDAARAWVPIEPTRGAGASYLAVRETDHTVALVCVSPGCPNDAAKIDVSTIQFGVVTAKLSAITVADVDGDKDLDLLVAVHGILPFGSPRPITLYSYDLQWSGHEIVGHGPPTLFVDTEMDVEWNTIDFVSLASAGGDVIYAFVSGDGAQAIVEVSSCTPLCRRVHAIGRPLGIVGVDDALFVSTDLGVWELAGPNWIQRDPERRRTEQTIVPAPDPTSPYGRQLRSCLFANQPPPSVVVATEAGARWMFAEVEVDTLPEP